MKKYLLLAALLALPALAIGCTCEKNEWCLQPMCPTPQVCPPAPAPVCPPAPAPVCPPVQTYAQPRPVYYAAPAPAPVYAAPAPLAVQQACPPNQACPPYGYAVR